MNNPSPFDDYNMMDDVMKKCEEVRSQRAEYNKKMLEKYPLKYYCPHCGKKMVKEPEAYFNFECPTGKLAFHIEVTDDFDGGG